MRRNAGHQSPKHLLRSVSPLFLPIFILPAQLLSLFAILSLPTSPPAETPQSQLGTLEIWNSQPWASSKTTHFRQCCKMNMKLQNEQYLPSYFFIYSYFKPVLCRSDSAIITHVSGYFIHMPSSCQTKSDNSKEKLPFWANKEQGTGLTAPRVMFVLPGWHSIWLGSIRNGFGFLEKVSQIHCFSRKVRNPAGKNYNHPKWTRKMWWFSARKKKREIYFQIKFFAVVAVLLVARKLYLVTNPISRVFQKRALVWLSLLPFPSFHHMLIWHSNPSQSNAVRSSLWSSY